MAHFGLIGQIKEMRVWLLAREGCDREWCHKFLCRLCENRGNSGPLVAQTADQLKAFIGRDPAPYDQQYTFPRNHDDLTFSPVLLRNLCGAAAWGNGKCPSRGPFAAQRAQNFSE